MSMTARRAGQVLVGLTAILCAACGRVDPAKHTSNVATAEPPSDKTSSELDADQAISLVKRGIDQTGLYARLSVPVTETQVQSVACSPQEADMDRSANPHNPELWRCTSPSGNSPYMKRVTTMATHCCQTTTVPVRSSDITGWRAEPASDDQWTVYADYAVLGQTHHSSWLVGRKDSKIGSQADQ